MPKESDEKTLILDYIKDIITFPGYDEDGGTYDIPSYVRVDDIINEFGVDEEEVVEISKDEGFLIFDVKSDYAEGYYIADPSLDMEQFKADYKSAYEEDPEIEIISQPDKEEVKSEVEVEVDEPVDEPEEPIEESVMCCSICGSEECNYNDPETSEPLCANCFAERCETLELDEDTVKQGSHWVNKGKEGTHGKFKTKKAADAQRKAMFANGYRESLEDDGIIKLDNVTAFWDSNSFNDEGEEYFYEIEYHADDDKFVYSKVADTHALDCTRENIIDAKIDVDAIEQKLKNKFVSESSKKVNEDYSYTYWCASDGINPRRSVLFTNEESALEYAKANERFKFVDKYVNGNPITIWKREDKKEDITESKKSEVVSWWKDVETWNKDNKYSIDNGDYSDVDGMHAAMFDMLRDLKGEADEEAKKLFKKGKSIYNKYAVSQFNESLEVEWCVMDRDGNNSFDCFTDKEEAIKHCKEIEDAFSVVEVHYDDEGEEVSAETIFEKDFSEDLESKKKLTSEEVVNFIEDLYDLRKQSIEQDGEYGLGNLVFKEFRSLGYLDNLKELRNKLKGEELSLESLKETPYPLDEEINTDKYNTLEKLAQLRKDYPEDGTYSVDKEGNLHRENLTSGFMASFFRPEIKDKDIKQVLGTIGDHFGIPYLGIYQDLPEISYLFKTERDALAFAMAFNQQAVWDNEKQAEIKNPKYDNKLKLDYRQALKNLQTLLGEE